MAINNNTSNTWGQIHESFFMGSPFIKQNNGVPPNKVQTPWTPPLDLPLSSYTQEHYNGFTYCFLQESSYQYWPPIGQVIVFGEYTVDLISEEPLTGFTVRKISVLDNKVSFFNLYLQY